ncbi:hypothetical protein [Streptomyces scabiei]|uniref:hypothetical protein n=1 Tax=Streptomyces scabiei TaxID=1930 RepID=UPI0029AC238F|nr:hypothetical protein [Streptomyces scabiei]MDX3523277.1 hypothetical protein [Streptomyces scabiei]
MLGELLGGAVEQVHVAPPAPRGFGGQGAVDAGIESADGIQPGGTGNGQAQFGVDPCPLAG